MGKKAAHSRKSAYLISDSVASPQPTSISRLHSARCPRLVNLTPPAGLATMENGAASEGRDPSGFLSEIIGAPVTVKLNSGVVYKGTQLTQVRLEVT